MTINTPFIAGSILTAAQMSNLPFGVAGYVSLTSLSQTGITTATDITGATITFTAVANRPYAIFYHGYHNTTANNVTVGVLLLEGATTLDQAYGSATNAALGTTVTGFAIRTFADGSHTVKLQCLLAAGTGTITAEANATLTYDFVVIDLGSS
jgi:hypothetical protein